MSLPLLRETKVYQHAWVSAVGGREGRDGKKTENSTFKTLIYYICTMEKSRGATTPLLPTPMGGTTLSIFEIIPRSTLCGTVNKFERLSIDDLLRASLSINKNV